MKVKKVTTRVCIMRRVKLEGKWAFYRVVINPKNGKIQPDALMINGTVTYLPPGTEGRYYLDYYAQDGSRKHIAAGDNAVDALEAAKQQEKLLLAHKASTVAGIALPEPENTDGRSLKKAVEDYLLEIKAHKKPKTHAAYSKALSLFLESCHKTTLEQITRGDMLSFKTYLRDGGPKHKKQSDRSQWNKFASVMSFLKQNKVTGLVRSTDWPVFTEESVETYENYELEKFFTACDETEKLWFTFFQKTAMREQEVMHVSWDDVDFQNKTVTVGANKEFGWKPKAYKGRVIPIPDTLVESLKVWKAKSGAENCGLVFPTAGCKPKLDFLDVCKAIAKRAGVRDFYLHKFRATRATELLHKGMDIKSVQTILGHSDMASTMRYLGGQQNDKLQQLVNTFE